jgi:hypothetical protein
MSTTAFGDIDCEGCHGVSFASVESGEPDSRLIDGIAPGYRLAMHSLCVSCHCEHEQRTAVGEPSMTRCGFCHRGVERELEAGPGHEFSGAPVVVAGGIAPRESASP